MDKTKIDWCDMSWNPVTGCRHGCAYCYARGIARRYGGYTSSGSKTTFNFMDGPAELNRPLLLARNDDKIVNAPYPFGFEPTFHRYRLDEPARKTRPRRIFVGSMTDLFGEWVPDEWIKEVFDASRAAPQHKYLFLTKNPARYARLDLPDGNNFWFGSTATNPDAKYFCRKSVHTFLSIEPILTPFDRRDSNIEVDWVIIGAETGTRKGKITSDRRWIQNIVDSCRENGVPVFMKGNLAEVWGEPLIREWPEGLE